MSKLLLIDDETDVQYSFQRIFDSPEIELITASSGEEGLKLVPKIKPDLVIMDIRMGGMNGLETLRRIRQIDSRLLVILMTAYGTTQTAIEAMKLGAYDYLLKPFDVPKLKEIIANALKAARDMRQVVSYQPLLEKAIGMNFKKRRMMNRVAASRRMTCKPMPLARARPCARFSSRLANMPHPRPTS